MKQLFVIFAISVILILGGACTKKPDFDPTTDGNPPPVDRWYVINEQDCLMQSADITSDWTVISSLLPNATSFMMSDVQIIGRSLYIFGGYNGTKGSSDIRKIDLGSGKIISSYPFTGHQAITSSASAVEGNIFLVSYPNASYNGILQIFDTDLGLLKTVNIGGRPQAVAVKNGDVYIANANSSYSSNWIDVVLSGQSGSTRNFITNKNPTGVDVSSDGKRLYVICTGSSSAGFIISMTNLSGTLMVEKVIDLGMNPWGKIKEIDGYVYFTDYSGFYKVDMSIGTVSLVSSISGLSVNDIEVDSQYIYLTSQWGGTSGYILQRSDLSLCKTLALKGGQSSLYKK